MTGNEWKELVISSFCIYASLVEGYRETEQWTRWDSHILEALFFVTAAITPPPPLSFAVPFFLPFFVGICTPADDDFWVCFGCDVPPDVLLLFVS